jgi:AcrR family transcriptional regulator
MPRVSDDHLAARREQILDAARACFLRNGFHATSMQDVIREAGLSVGAVYRYFPSKAELVTAVAQRVVDQLAGSVAELATAEPPLPLPEVMRRLVDVAEPQLGPDGGLRLAVQVWAEAMRDPILAGFVAHAYGRLRDSFVTIARRAQAAGELPPGVDPRAAGVALFAVMPGYGLQRMLTGEPDAATFKAGLDAFLAGTARAPSTLDRERR